ncbi:MAG: hypothetical protein IT430_19905 [Phycisphaerales bacterium]|nr:hypothetical protein [Phycisphaerales bacterium]
MTGPRKPSPRAGILIAFRDKVAALRAEWQTIAAVAEQEEDEETKTARRNLGRLRNGLRTPEAAYREPILWVLQSMGGSGKAADVLEKVGQIMKPKLQSVEFEPLASGPENPRWRNAAMGQEHDGEGGPVEIGFPSRNLGGHPDGRKHSVDQSPLKA